MPAIEVIPVRADQELQERSHRQIGLTVKSSFCNIAVRLLNTYFPLIATVALGQETVKAAESSSAPMQVRAPVQKGLRSYGADQTARCVILGFVAISYQPFSLSMVFHFIYDVYIYNIYIIYIYIYRI